jgi:pSer/pThr/pTyr-binding forkhead associated (FHA) protein/Mg-chelatase subunit ChlD
VTRAMGFCLSLVAIGLSGALLISMQMARAAVADPLDVVMVLDNSGSMKKNDPNALMSKAVGDFASGLSADSRLGIIIFDQGVRVPLELAMAATPEFKFHVAKALEGVTYGGQWTDIPGGVERAIYVLRAQRRPNARQVIVLFTDGMVETGNAQKDAERSRWLQESLSAEAKQLGIRVFGIAFTEEADFRLLQSVAQSTGGEHYRVLAPGDIDAVFKRIRSRLQSIAEDETREKAEGKSAPVASGPPKPFATTSADPLLWILGTLLLTAAGAGAVWKLRSRSFPAATLRDVGGHTSRERFPLRRRVVRIGRDTKGNDVAIPHDTVSTLHAEVERRGSTYFVRDLGSSNGTFVNGKKISEPNSIREAPLKHGDRLRFDAFEFQFLIDGIAAAPAASGAPVTPAGTRLRSGTPAGLSPAPDTPAEASRVQADFNPLAPTLLKTGKCNVHKAWNAVAVCPQCGYEKCQQCMTKKGDVQVCIDCSSRNPR